MAKASSRCPILRALFAKGGGSLVALWDSPFTPAALLTRAWTGEVARPHTFLGKSCYLSGWSRVQTMQLSQR